MYCRILCKQYYLTTQGKLIKFVELKSAVAPKNSIFKLHVIQNTIFMEIILYIIINQIHKKIESKNLKHIFELNHPVQ